MESTLMRLSTLRQNPYGLSFLLFLVAGLAAPVSFAQDESTDEDEPSGERKRISFSVLGRYTRIDRDRFEGVYSDNGLPALTPHVASWGLLAHWTSPEGWQLGLAGFGLGSVREAGTAEATYGMDYAAVYLAKDFVPADSLDFSLGALLGGGSANLVIFSPGRDGRIEQGFFSIEPLVSVQTRVARFLKFGVMGSYFVPVRGSTIAKGDALGLADIVDHHWSVGLQLTFGRFGD